MHYGRSPQPYTGPGFADTYAVRHAAQRGQLSPITRNEFAMQHGRYLSGFGGVDAKAQHTAYDSSEETLTKMEGSDDNFGSGIFDFDDRGPTANAQSGVFESTYSLPGFIAREIPFAVSRDVQDANGNSVVFVPGGGLSSVLDGGGLTRPDAPTTRDQPYKRMDYGRPSRLPVLRQMYWTQPLRQPVAGFGEMSNTLPVILVGGIVGAVAGALVEILRKR